MGVPTDARAARRLRRLSAAGARAAAPGAARPAPRSTARTSRSVAGREAVRRRGRRPARRAAARRGVRRPRAVISARAAVPAAAWPASGDASWAPPRRGPARPRPPGVRRDGRRGRPVARRRAARASRSAPARPSARPAHAERLRAGGRSDRRGRGGARRRGGAGDPAAPAARLLSDVAPAAAGELGGRLRLDGDRDARLRRRGPAGPPGLRLPGAAGRRPDDQGRDVLVRQVGLGPRGRGRRCVVLRDLDRAAPRGVGSPAARRGTGRRRRSTTSPTRRPHGATGRRHVQRWGGGLPQYAVGHVDRVARIRAAVAAVPGLAVCGAAYDGVGIPAVHRVGPRRAAARGSRRQNDPMSEAPRRTPRDQRHHPLHDVVGLPAARRPTARTDRATPRPPRWSELFDELDADDVVVRGLYDVSRPARRRRRDGVVARGDRRAAPGRLPPAPSHRRSAPASSRSGRRWRCTGRRSSTRATCRRSSPTRRRAATSASTRSCGPTSGTSSRRPSAARLLAEHGKMARDYPDVRANTVSSFALGDYEWILAFEADELHRIVDLMRDLRALARAAPRARGGAVLHRPPRRAGRPGRSGCP